MIETLHRIIAYSIPAGFALMFLWSMFLLIRNKDAGGAYWNLLGVLQVVVGIQFLVGAILFISGSRAGNWRHYFYGAFFPALVLTVAHLRARKVEVGPWLIFGVAAFICFGLTLMALMTGLGIL